jgi:hemerythrin superfamily protein
MSILKTLRKTGKTVEKALLPKADPSGDMDILDKLHQEHDEVEDLLKKLVDSTRAAERKSLLKKVKAALVPHARAEEKVVYDAVIALKKAKMKQDGAEGYIEHDLADKTLARLGKIADVTSPEFTAAAKVLKEMLAHHIKEEEKDIWSDVKDNFSDEERLRMNRRFEAAKKKVRIPA